MAEVFPYLLFFAVLGGAVVALGMLVVSAIRKGRQRRGQIGPGEYDPRSEYRTADQLPSSNPNWSGWM